MLLVRTGLAASTPPIDGHDSDDDQLSAASALNVTEYQFAFVAKNEHKIAGVARKAKNLAREARFLPVD